MGISTVGMVIGCKQEKMKQKKPVLMMIVKLIEIDCTDKEKELFNYGLERYQKTVFELFNIIA